MANVLGFQSNISSDDADVFSAPGGEVFTSTFTRRSLARASPMRFTVAEESEGQSDIVLRTGVY